MKKISEASRRIKRVWLMWALSRSIRPAAVTQAGSEYPDSHMMEKTMGTVRAPSDAGMARYATYGTLFVMYESPIFSNKKSPLYPTSQPAKAKRSFPKGGWTSKK